jgi:hypothetical protein
MTILPAPAVCLENPATVSVGNFNDDLANAKQIVRTSSGRLYYFSGNGTHTTLSDGWVDVHTSVDGHNWTRIDSRDQFFPTAE